MALSMHTLSAKGSFVGKTAELASSPAASAKALRVPVVVRAQHQDAVSQFGIRTALRKLETLLLGSNVEG